MFQVRNFLLRVKKLYWFGILIIFSCILLSFYSLNELIKTQEDHATFINIAGKQRMLSQKIALYISYHGNTPINNSKRGKTAASIEQAVQEMLGNYELLLSSQSNLTNQVKHLYFDNNALLDQRIKSYTNNALQTLSKSNAATVNDMFNRYFTPTKVSLLLSSLDYVVGAMEVAAKEETKKLTQYVFLLCFFTLFLLALFVIYSYKHIAKVMILNYARLKKEQRRLGDYQYAIHKHSIVFRVNLANEIIYVNDKFKELYGYKNKEIIGQPKDVLKSSEQPNYIFKEMFNTIKRGGIWQHELCNKDKEKKSHWLETTVVPYKNNKNIIIGYMVIQNDISQQKKVSKTLSKLHVITADAEKNIPEKISLLLNLGTELFNLPFGILSEIKGDEYKVLHALSPDNELTPGAIYKLSNTYCSHTLINNKPTAFRHAGKSEIRKHPCYVNFKLESYIGVPVFVSGKCFGTLNFSSPEINPRPFSESDLELIQLIAQWLGHELTREAQSKALFAQQTLMEKMSEQARIGAWEVDLVNQEVFWSSMTKEIHEVSFDYKPELATGIEFYKAGESRDLITQLVNKAINKGESFEAELELVTAKGNTVWVKSHGTAVMEHGVCVKLFGSFQDISEKKKTEQLIQEQNQRLSLAADSAGIGVWEYTIKTQELKWDDWMFRLYGVNKKDFSGAYDAWTNGLHPDDMKKAVKDLESAIAGKNKFNTQFRVIHPNKEIRHIKASALVLLDDDLNPCSMVGVNYDITEQVKSEQELKKSKQIAEEAAKAKSEFLASMSHEIRTPMNGVVGMLDLLNDSTLNEEQQHQVHVAKSSASSLLFLINDILDFSKIDADRLELEKITFDINLLINDFTDSIAQQAQHKGLELITDTSELPQKLVIGDPNRIRQILTNLVSNAIKFTEKGEVIIKLILKPCHGNYSRLIISVKDTGIGIPEDKQDRLFKSFSQVDASTTRKFGGTGLGLAIVKKLCQLMNGNVDVVCELDKGCEFICDIEVEQSQQIMSKLPVVDISHLSILVVDDNQANREIIAKQLQSWHIKTRIADSANMALECCEQQYAKNALFDVVIVDMNMPGMSGEELGHKIRQDQRFNSIKLVMMTSIDNKGDGKTFADIGFDAYFAKPVSSSDLYATLNIFVDNQQALAAAEPLITKHYIRTLKHQQYQSEQFANKLANNVDENQVTSTINNDLTPSFADDIVILLVEDNRVNQMVAQGVLTKLSLASDVAINGVDALNKLKENKKKYSLILMDCQMPEMDGYETTQQLRNGKCGDYYQSIPIVAMTANAMQGDKEKCLAAGMNDYLTKPINKDLLFKKLRKFLG